MKCPQCFKDVPISESQYLALYTCPQCYAVYFVNGDGVPEYGDMTVPESEIQQAPEISSLLSEEAIVHVHSESVESPLNDIHLDSLQSLDTSSAVDADIESSLNSQMYESQNQFPESSSDLNNFVVGGGVLGSVLQDIQTYGNQDQVVTNINYDLIIKNLDQKEHLQLFKESIDDSKLGWIQEDVLSQIKDGQCRLMKLNAVVATVLIQRLQVADLDIEWVQHVETL